MAKSNPLTKALKDSVSKKRATSTPAAAAPETNGNRNRVTPIAASRVGLVNIGGHFTRTVQEELKMLALKERKTLQTILGEAIDMLLVSRDKPALVAQSLAEGAGD